MGRLARNGSDWRKGKEISHSELDSKRSLSRLGSVEKGASIAREPDRREERCLRKDRSWEARGARGRYGVRESRVPGIRGNPG